MLPRILSVCMAFYPPEKFNLTIRLIAKPEIMIKRGNFSGIFIPIISNAINKTATPPNNFKTSKLTKSKNFGPNPAESITIIVAINPAIKAVIILSFNHPSVSEARRIAPGPAIKRIAINKAFSSLNMPEAAAIATLPFNPPKPSIKASFLI